MTPDSEPVPRAAPIAAAILAGGRARRLGGRNKAMLEIGDQRIIDRQMALLRRIDTTITIVSPHGQDFADLGVPVVDDLIPHAGALGGIYTALAVSQHPRILVVACDLPFLTLALLQRLVQPSDAELVIPRSARGYEPLCAVWASSAAGVIRQRIERGALKAAQVVEELRAEEIGPDVLASCDPHGLLFVNVNTPHEYEQAQVLSRLESEPSQYPIIDVSGAGPKPA